ncbi:MULTISPECIES: CAAX prenyl protease-related protein [unclassified Duganella]|uniref:CAAX prenyl protease-related protein n=1 Tax=unclassified Duganella TaxID=2636909 RepID=UPI001E2F213A|nr:MULTISPECIES: CAAX prenyl protease-related protein [unclassified Duganella]
MTLQQPPKRISQQPQAIAAAAPVLALRTNSGSAMPRVLPFATFIVFIIFVDVLERFGAHANTLRWLYPAKIALVLAMLLAWRKHYRELRELPARRDAFAAIAVGAGVFVLWIALDAGWMQLGTPRAFDAAGSDGRIDWPLVVVRAFGAALVVPLMEELFWRSFLLRWLEQRDFLLLRPARAGLRATTISVLLFGIEHNLWLAGIIAGIAYTWLYMRSETLWTPILGHAVTNGLLAAWIMVTGSWTYW